jgi:pimeloyl-ACP methyl ester carboxylesterase
VGALYTPARAASGPAVLVLGGAEGGAPVAEAALLASHGHPALALAYVQGPAAAAAGLDDEGLPPFLEGIPLEYFAHALAWLREQPGAGPGAPLVLGRSRGAELALLLGSTYPEAVAGVIAVSPSSVVNPGSRMTPAWTLRGRPLPAVPLDPAKFRLDEDRTSTSLPMFSAALSDPVAVARAAIAVERIRGPVLLVSGDDDQVWPSSRSAELAVGRLRSHGHPFPVDHLRYPGAGHLIGPPFWPTNLRIGRIGERYGGSPDATERANAAAWPRVLAFVAAAR